MVKIDTPPPSPTWIKRNIVSSTKPLYRCSLTPDLISRKKAVQILNHRFKIKDLSSTDSSSTDSSNTDSSCTYSPSTESLLQIHPVQIHLVLIHLVQNHLLQIHPVQNNSVLIHQVNIKPEHIHFYIIILFVLLAIPCTYKIIYLF